MVINIFYCDNEVSRISRLYFCDDRGQNSVFKSDMLYTLKEAFVEFKLRDKDIIISDIIISLSKLCQLRPTFVRCVSSIPHNVCACMLHANMRYALESHSRSSDLFSIIKKGKFMISNFICEKPTAQCFDVVCNKCEAYFLFDKLLPQFKSFEFRGINRRNLKQNRTTTSKKLTTKEQSQFYYQILKKCVQSLSFIVMPKAVNHPYLSLIYY